MSAENNPGVPDYARPQIKEEDLQSISSVFEPINKEEKDWTKPDKDGNIDVPDELMPLFRFFVFQLRLHTISGHNELLCIARMVRKAAEYAQEQKKLAYQDIAILNNEIERLKSLLPPGV